jgi:ABC-2 type transport system ATP-binding protein
VDAVSYRYGDRVALDGVSLRIARGETFALLGPNGGGKTTLFKIVATLVRPQAGRVAVFGADVVTDAATVRRMLGVVFQAPALDARLTVTENLVHHGHLYGLSGGALRSRVDEGLARVGLTDRRTDFVGSLSGGLARRAEIAKALLPSPSLLLLDEPTTGLDPRVRDELWRDLRSLRAATGTTIVLTTHLMDEAAACDRVALLDGGRIVLQGPPDELTAALGAEIVTIESLDAPGLAAKIPGRLGLSADVVEGHVRIQRERAHAVVAALVDAFPTEIRSIRVSRPTLHDVFVHHTGHGFD